MAIHKIEITKEMREEAKQLALTSKHNEACHLGEIIFREYCIANEVCFESFKLTNGGHGFALRSTESPHELKVITATYDGPEHWKMMIPQEQYLTAKKIWDYYIGIKINGTVGEIWGYTELDNFQFRSQGFNYQNIPTYWKHLKELKAIELLVMKLYEVKA